MSTVRFEVSPPLAESRLQDLFGAAWDDGRKPNFGRVLASCAAYVCAFNDDRLVGFVAVVWNGGAHGFALDTTVHPEFQHQRIGTGLLTQAREAAIRLGIDWLHVDFEADLEPFYRGAGCRGTPAGLMRLSES